MIEGSKSQQDALGAQDPHNTKEFQVFENRWRHGPHSIKLASYVLGASLAQLSWDWALEGGWKVGHFRGHQKVGRRETLVGRALWG